MHLLVFAHILYLLYYLLVFSVLLIGRLRRLKNPSMVLNKVGGGGELLPIHSLNRKLTTCKAISKGLTSGFVY